MLPSTLLRTYEKGTLKSSVGLLQAFEESAGWGLLSSLCDDSNLHISV